MVTLRFTGTEALRQAFKGMPQQLERDVLREALAEAVEPMRAQMAALAPRAGDSEQGRMRDGRPPGHLADHIIVGPVTKIEGVRLADTEVAVGIGPQKDYFHGAFFEFGWKFHRSPRPFVRPAFEDGKIGALQRLAIAIWRRVSARTG